MRENLQYQSVMAVIIRQYGTGLYRSYVSLSRDNSVCLGTHSDEQSAADRLNHFWKAYDEGAIRTPEDLTGLIDSSITSPDTAVPPPPEAGRNC